jgi:hypothetical protein
MTFTGNFRTFDWDNAERAPAGRVASGGPPAQGGGGGPPPAWRARVELPGGAVLEGGFVGLRPAGPATLAEGGGETYAVEYDGSRTVAEGPAPVRKEVLPPQSHRDSAGAEHCVVMHPWGWVIHGRG